ncbi:hypothetical protein F0562_010848 [Nyssa sinensis]|uniref:PGG domain-containing protein n=1 Tax=Nyssa sinensis TaxID=561372 RepID=A0A5J5A345_9ASTE|nr:hypothetical protein F0562_010848 [Nyssa sinensis]
MDGSDPINPPQKIERFEADEYNIYISDGVEQEQFETDVASSSTAGHKITSQKGSYYEADEAYCFNISEGMEQEQSEADAGTKLLLAPRFCGRQLITDDMQMHQERCQELAGPGDVKNNQMEVRGSKRSGDNGEDSDSVSLLMKPRVYRAITMGDKDSFIAEDAKHSVVDQVGLGGNTILHVAVILGQCDLVEVMVNLYPQLMQRKNGGGDLAIHLAAGFGRKFMVECMVRQAKQHFGQASGSGQIDRVIEENEEIKKTASQNAEVDILMEGDSSKNTALHLAMKNQHYELAWFLVEEKPQVSINLNKERKSPLYLAAKAGQLGLVKLMIGNRRAEMTELMPGKSLVHAAIKGMNIGKTICTFTRVLEVLDAVMSYQSTFFTTLGEGCSSSFRPSNDEGSSSSCPNLFDRKGRTPLSLAASIGYLDGVRHFLSKNLDMTFFSDSGWHGFFPIHWASFRGRVKIIDEFFKGCPSSWKLLNKEGQNILHVAAERGKANVVRYILQMPECESLINERDTDGNTPLHLASREAQPRVVSILAWDGRVELGVLNGEGLMALDVVCLYVYREPSFKQRLTWLVLRYVGAPQSRRYVRYVRVPQYRRKQIFNEEEGENRKLSLRDQPELLLDNYKDRVNTLLLVATLVVTITFAAGFTMPGGYNNSDPNQGMASLVHESSFNVFLISNTIALYSSILVANSLIWAQLCDVSLVVASLKFAVPLLGISLTMVSISFMTGVHLVVSNLNWLANVVLVIGSISIIVLLLLFVPLYYPSTVKYRVWQYIFSYLLYPLILVIDRETNDDTNE